MFPSRCRGCVGGDTLAWVNATLQQLPQVPSLAFVHIPVPQVGGWVAGWASGCSLGEAPVSLLTQMLQ